MSIDKSMLGFDWSNESEWHELKKDVQVLYDALTLYMESMAYFRSLNMVDITYGSARTDAFFNIRTVPAWSDFMRDIYGTAVIEIRDNLAQESTRIMNTTLGGSGGSSFYAIMRRAYELLTSAGFNSNAHLEDYPQEEHLLKIAESLIRGIVKLYPAVNRKAFFLISLENIPKKYAENMYGSLSELPEFLQWTQLSKWSNVSEDWQIYKLSAEPWSGIARALKLLFGLELEERWWNSAVEMWSILSRYIGEDLRKMYIREAKQSLIRAYIETELSKFVSGVDEESFLFADAMLKSIDEFKVWNLVVADIGSCSINMENEALIKFAAPQMFLGIGDFYLSEDNYWMLGFYIPERMVNNTTKLKAPAVSVKTSFSELGAVMPPHWELHLLKNILNNIDFHLRWVQEMEE